MEAKLNLIQEWDKTFPKSEKVNHSKVTFHNRFGITLAADMYMPKNAEGKLPAIAVCGPFGAVKEQAAGLYAQTMAERGFLTIAFDPSFTGESGGEPRYMASPDINTEDFMAAVDFLSLQDTVDPEKIGIIGICGWGGMAINAAALDTRIKATVASTMYDMSRVNVEQKDYEIVAARSDCYEEEPFFMTYILSPTPEKRKLCLKMQEQLGGIKMINILDCNPENEQYNRIMMEFDNIKCQIPLEDMLYYIQHSQYIITDSFHGTCFSIIFRKPFLAIRNYPKHRFQTFDKYAPLADRIIDGDATWHTATWLNPIDYDSIYKTLHQEIMESKEFIKKHLK